MSDDWDRREDEGLRSAFERAVTVASANAAQQVAQIHRRRLVVQSFVASLVCASAVAVVLTLVARSEQHAFSRANAIYDCQQFHQAARIIGDFVLSDAALRERQNGRSLSREVASDFQKIIARSTLLRLAFEQHQDVARVVAKWRQDGGELETLGGADCASHLS